MNNNKLDEHERIEIYQQFYSLTTKSIDERSQYYSYGILVGLFSFKDHFFLGHACLAFMTVLFALATLILTYLRHLYLYWQSDKILIENSNYPIKKVAKGKDSLEISYQIYRYNSSRYFKCFQVTLLFSIILFMVSTYYNFFAHP